MDICRDSVVRRKRTHESSKLYIDDCVMYLMVWLFRHTLVATLYRSYVKNEPYFKKWGGKIQYLKEKLDLLDDHEVSKIVSDKGSSSSTSTHGQDSDMNSVEQEEYYVDPELRDSERSKMKGKGVQIHDSTEQWIEPKSSFKIRNIVLERREK
ncbi:hypothetical protein ZOSMA_738G00040 [Zostera marina]|uniref:Uncharacterized protein n=1 Tax=Zostera marina TaxID=29655 RepID=A0A0K9NPV4_ZOSMR|nr:hypothetical protein ZOSMA_738G00040 [Zostera marina]